MRPSGPGRKFSSLQSKFWPIPLLAGIGIAFGMLVLLYKYGATAESRKFVQTEEFLIWMFLLSIVMTLCFILPFSVFKALNDLWRYGKGRIADMVISSIVVTILFFLTRGLPELAGLKPIVKPLYMHMGKISLFSILALCSVGLPAFLGIHLIYCAAKNEFKERSPRSDRIAEYRLLQQHLQTFLSILGIMVGLLALATGALRNALISYDAALAESFPALIVICYGIYYTLLLALIYLPTFLALRKVGRRLCDEYSPLPSPDDANWNELYKKRQNLEELLQLNVGARKRLQSSIAVFAPLLSGLIAVLLH